MEGVDGELRDNVLAFLEINRLIDRQDPSELLIRLQHRRAPENIRAALRPFGYYDVGVVSELARVGDSWRAHYRIDPRQRVKLRAVSVEIGGPAQAMPEFDELISKEAPRTGEGLRHDRYEALKRSLLGLAVEQGFFEAHFERSKLEVYPGQLAAEIDLRLLSGTRYRFGEISTEQDALHDWMLRRYLRFAPGDAFDSTQLLDLQYALYDSEYFSFVEVSSGEPDAGTRTVPISIRAEPGKRTRYRFSIGYGTDTEARLGMGWENRRVNKRGHKLRFDSRLSAVKQELTGRYLIPLSAPTRERLSLTASALQEDLADTRSQRLELGLTHSTLRDKWERDVYLRALREQTSSGGGSDTQTLLLPGVLWLRSKGDSPVYPKRGSRLSAELRGSHSALGSDVDFIQLKLQGRLIRPLGERGRLIARTEAGFTSIGKQSQLPASLRFFAGGDYSVRGFGLNTLGPRNASGEVIGGRYLLTGSLEYEYLLTPRWGFALFSDAGNALQEFNETLEYSVGVGLRWLSPVGMFRLDLAKPLRDSGASPRLHLSIGGEL